MAKKEKPKEQAKEGGNAEADGEAGAASSDPGKKKKLMILGGVMAALLLVGVGVTLFALGVFSGGDGKPATGDETAESGAETGVAEKVPAIYLPLEPPFLANYSVEGRQRYVQLSLALMAREQAAVDAATQHMPMIRNRVVMLLGAQDFQRLRSVEGRELLQQQILAAVQEILQAEIGKPGVEQVFFTGLVAQ